jgi:hypothetical protein
MGVALGGGNASVTTDGVSADRGAGFGATIRLGYAFHPQFSAEGCANAWIGTEGGITTSFSVLAVALTCYPHASKLALRGGVGLGQTRESYGVVGGVPQDNLGGNAGIGFTAGIGLEFRVGRGVAIGPQLDGGWTLQDGWSTSHLIFALGFGFYSGTP